MLATPVLPERIGRLNDLATNLWWSWYRPARDLFRALDYPLWKVGGHNPVKQLRHMSSEKLRAAAADPALLALYDPVVAAFDEYISSRDTWFTSVHRESLPGPIAFFSMEFAMHNSLPIYAGGLGILAGDVCKEASDLGIPLVALGFMYPEGYFQQRITSEGWQEEVCTNLNFVEAPVKRVPSVKGEGPIASVMLGNRRVHTRVWQVRVGRTTIYLLDTDIGENDPQDRHLSSRLYIADRELRIRQEIVLGVCGVRVLRALGIKPSIWHANEGHTAFMMLERLKEEVEAGASFQQAQERVQASTVFTTHTPVPAGHDTFPPELVEQCFNGYWDSLGIGREAFLRLGQLDGQGDEAFNMTVLALRMADQRTAVSRLHGTVSRRMWHALWPEATEDEVPILSVTNGVHVPTWVAPEMAALFERYLGPDWLDRQDDPQMWDGVLDIPDGELWAVHVALKRKLMYTILERVQRGWAESKLAPDQVPAMGALLHPGFLTLGFVRRFTEYKRPALVFHDIEHLKRIIKHQWRPVQIVFAGKSHPADFPSKFLLHEVYSLARERQFQGRIAFLEDYDMHMARYLVHGVDVWLNTPRRLREACGTSGMKASLNGVPHLSVRDGWWHEAYNGENGWAIGESPHTYNTEQEDEADAESLYRVLEEKIVPLYYDADRVGVPHGWVHVMKEAIRSVAPRYSARRMLKEYTNRVYFPAVHSPRLQKLV